MNKNNLILVAEDDDEIADILMSYLQRAGMKTLRAADGELAISLSRLNKPDLILLDIHLPGKAEAALGGCLHLPARATAGAPGADAAVHPGGLGRPQHGGAARAAGGGVGLDHRAGLLRNAAGGGDGGLGREPAHQNVVTDATEIGRAHV